jgi:hypothetical protein
MVLIYGEAREHSELARQIYGERFPQRILPNARTFVNVVQHLRDFGRFEMNKCDLGRREDRILVPERQIPHEIQERHFQQSFSINVWVEIVENHLIGPYVWLGRLNGEGYLQFFNEVLFDTFMMVYRLITFKTRAAQEIRENRGIMNRVRVSWTRLAEACIVNDGRYFEQLLCLYWQLQSFCFLV